MSGIRKENLCILRKAASTVDKLTSKIEPMKNALFYLTLILVAFVMAGEPGYFERVTGIDPDPFFDNALFWMFVLLLALPFLNKRLNKSSTTRALTTWEKISLLGSVLLFLLICFNPLIVQQFNTNILGDLKPFLFGILIIWVFVDPFVPKQKKQDTEHPSPQ